MTAVAEFYRSIHFWSGGGNTIGHEIVAADQINILVIIAALCQCNPLEYPDLGAGNPQQFLPRPHRWD